MAYKGKAPEHCIIDTPAGLKLCRLTPQKAFAGAKLADAIEQKIGPAPDRGEEDPSSP